MIKKLQDDLKKAMRESNILKRDVIRGLLSAIKNEAIAQKKDISGLSQKETIAIIKHAKKQRDDAAVQYKTGGREELSQKEMNESEIIKGYLPEEISDDDLDKIINKAIIDVGDDNFGKLIGRVMANVDGRANGLRVKARIQEKMK